MGIPGLSTFVESHSELLQNHKLYSTQIIIDGNNLQHKLYYSLIQRTSFTGNYDAFTEVIKKFFHLLKTCNISPFVVFDGGYDPNDYKLNTCITRSKKRIQDVKRIQMGCFTKVTPILANQVFKDCLTKLKIPYGQAVFEADEEIVALANEWKCPVLSMDSDFYIFNIHCGFIPLGTLDYKRKLCKKSSKQSEFYYIDCKIFYVYNFTKCFKGLQVSVLPVFASLFNDVFPPSVFNLFFAKTLLSCKSHSSSDIYRKIFSTLTWLKSSKSVNEAIEKIATFLEKDSQSKIKKLLHEITYSYIDVHSNLAQHFKLEDSDKTSEVCSVRTFAGTIIPSWFFLNFCSGKLPSFLLNIFTLRRNFLPCQIENIKFDNSYNVSIFLRKVIYGLLLSLDNEGGELENNEQYDVNEYERRDRGLDLVSNFVTPIYSLSRFGLLPSLSELPQLTKKQKKSIIWEVLDVDKYHLKKFPKKLRLIVATLIYWIKNTDLKVTESHIISIITSFLRGNILFANDVLSEQFDELTWDKNTKNEMTEKFYKTPLNKFICKVALIERYKFCNKLHKYNIDNKTHVNIDVDEIHVFSEFQSCMLFSLTLNQLLNEPIPSFRIAKFYNGTFLVMFHLDLKQQTDTDDFLNRLFGFQSNLYLSFCKLKYLIFEAMPQKNFQDENGWVGTERKKRKRSVKKKHRKTEQNDFEDELIMSEDGQPDVVINCNISNKYAILSIN